jgi:HEAT repeat protein
VDQLLTLGEPTLDQWRDYRVLGLGLGHVPDMLRLVTDRTRYDPEAKGPALWAPIHAWRALGQLQAEAAVEPLLELLPWIDEEDDDWIGEELPVVFGMIGPAALPALAAYLVDRSHDTWARTAAATGLKEIAERHPAARADTVQALARQLERADPEDGELNGFVLADLLDLKAAEAMPAIEKAFAAAAVWEDIAGGLEEARWELGLRDTPPPQRRYEPLLSPPAFPPPSHPGRKQKAKAKAKRKQAAKARKRNRKRK